MNNSYISYHSVLPISMPHISRIHSYIVSKNKKHSPKKHLFSIIEGETHVHISARIVDTMRSALTAISHFPTIATTLEHSSAINAQPSDESPSSVIIAKAIDSPLSVSVYNGLRVIWSASSRKSTILSALIPIPKRPQRTSLQIWVIQMWYLLPIVHFHFGTRISEQLYSFFLRWISHSPNTI